MNIMLKLINIKKVDNCIEADYIPETSDKAGHVKLNFDTFEEEHKTVEGYEVTYPSMAINGLKRILERQKDIKDYEIPHEKLVMWY